MKTCTKCQTSRPLTDFYCGKNGVPQSWCKYCTARRVKEIREANKQQGLHVETPVPNGYLKRHLKKREQERALEAAYLSEKQRTSPNYFQDALCFISRKPMFRAEQFLRQPSRKYKWRAA